VKDKVCLSFAVNHEIAFYPNFWRYIEGGGNSKYRNFSKPAKLT